MPQHQRRRFQRRQGFAARLAAQPPEPCRAQRVQDEPVQFQQPRIAPPQGLRLAPGAVEEHNAVEMFQHRVWLGDRLPVAPEQQDLAMLSERRRSRRAEVEHRPAPRVSVMAERPRQVRPGQASDELCVPQCAEDGRRGRQRLTPLLRVLQDQHEGPVVDCRIGFGCEHRPRYSRNCAARQRTAAGTPSFSTISRKR